MSAKNEQSELAPVGLFYGSSTCYTEFAAEKIRDAFPAGTIDLNDIAHTPLAKANDYRALIFGTPTWDYGELQEDWETHWPELGDLELGGKPLAIFGLGDAVGYPEWFLDAMGYLYHALKARGGQPCGFTPADAFDFEESKALSEDGTQFVGLALDEENQPELSEERIAAWVASIEAELLDAS